MKRETFFVRLDQLQPSQPFLSQARLDNILRNTAFILRPVHVRELFGRYCLIEGHERCFALLSAGHSNVEAYVESNDAEFALFKKCVEITIDSGVATVGDFSERILPPAQFRQLWVQRKKELKQQFQNVNLSGEAENVGKN